MRDQPNATTITLALLWEGETPISYHFAEPFRLAVMDAVMELQGKEYSHPNKPMKGAYDAVRAYEPAGLQKLLSDIVFEREAGRINPWDFFEAARGSWWQGGPLRPSSDSYFRELKAELRQHFGESYETLARHFVPHFQKLAKNYS